MSEDIRLQRNFVPKDFQLSDWASVEPFYNALLERPLNHVSELKQWMQDRSELESIMSEELAWRYIRMTCDTTNETLKKAYDFFITEIDPHIQPISNALDKKFLECPFLDTLTSEGEQIIIKTAKAHQTTFRNENIPLHTQLQQLQVQYGAAVGTLTVSVEGKEMTLQQASTYLLKPERALRAQVWQSMQAARYSIHEKLDSLFDELVKLRHQVATNAGFPNFRDYMFVEMCRFDYTAEDCYRFHKSVQEFVVPIIKKETEKRKQSLGYETLRPWDLAVDVANRPPLRPFKDGEELCTKTEQNFARLSPTIAQVITDLKKLNHLDLDSRKGKAPGGYNYPLFETGYPFIFMNAAGTVRDVVTMVHEGGHALHSVLTATLPLLQYKNFPSEVAELASMSMELFSMEHWDVFFNTQEDLKRAKKDHLTQIVETLPWVATIDAFQHAIYQEPNANVGRRLELWEQISDRFSAGVVDWSGFEHYKAYTWQKQLHLYEVPFYYIEYGMAQLGAIALWRNYKKDPEKTLMQYTNALRLGYTRSIPHIYETAGIAFDFTAEYIQDLMQFVQKELELLDK